MQHRNVPLIAGGAAVLGAAVLTFVMLRAPTGQPNGAERAEAAGPAVPGAPPPMAGAEPSAPPEAAAPEVPIPDRGIPALALSDEEPVGDVWRNIPPASGPYLTVSNLSPGDDSRERANVQVLSAVAEARPFTRRHAEVVLSALSSDYSVSTRAIALSVIGEILNVYPDLDFEIRAAFREAIVEYIGAGNAALAETALVMVHVSPLLLQDEEVMERVRDTTRRPGPHDEEWRNAVDRAILIVQHRDDLIRTRSRPWR